MAIIALEAVAARDAAAHFDKGVGFVKVAWNFVEARPVVDDVEFDKRGQDCARCGPLTAAVVNAHLEHWHDLLGEKRRCTAPVPHVRDFARRAFQTD